MYNLYFRKRMVAILLIFAIFVSFNSSKVFASTKINIGDSIEGKIIYDNSKDYILTLKHKTKIRIDMTISSENTSEDTSDDDYDYVDLTLQTNDEYEDELGDLYVNINDSDNFTETLDKGSYDLSLSTDSDELAYNISISDVSSYATQISIPSTLNLVQGSSKKLSVKSKQRSKLLDDITWNSSNNKIATVSSSGTVKGINPGTCTISAKTKEAGEEKCKVTIKNLYATKISATKQISLYAGNSKKIAVKRVAGGKKINIINWSSSNKRIAMVSKKGKVTGVKAGKCTIKGKMKGGNTVKCKVTVKARPKLYIKDASFDINYVDGVEPYITFQNNFGKTIKYIYFNVYFYNRVGDPAYCSIWGTNHKTLYITGPVKNHETDTYSWDAVIYNNTTSRMYIKSAKIIFMNGKTKNISIKRSFH